MSAENFALVRKFSLNILKRDKGKGSLVTKRLKAGWSIDCLFSLLENQWVWYGNLDTLFVKFNAFALHLATDFCVYSENFCHVFYILMLDILFTRLCGLDFMCTCGLASKDGAKVDYVHVATFRQCPNRFGIVLNFRNGQGRQNPDSGIVGLRGDKRRYGMIQGDTRLFSDG